MAWFLGRISAGLLFAGLLLGGSGPAHAQPVALPILASAGDQAGYDVALSGDYLVIGAPFDDERGTDAGAAYLFRRTDEGWILDTKLTAADATPGDRFGWSVALDGETAVIGAPHRDRPVRQIGGAYVFERDARQGWHQTKALTLPQDDIRIDSGFGQDVAVNGDQILVSGPQVYLFARTQGNLETWPLVTTFTLPETDTPTTLWLGDTSALVCTWKQPHIYLFTPDQDRPATWKALTTLKTSDDITQPGALTALHRRGERVLTGVPQGDGRSPQAGAVYVFEPDPDRPGTWHQTARLTAPDGAAGDNFGTALVARDDVLLVGARGVDGSRANAGAVYVYERDADKREGWAFVTTITPPAGAARFGQALALQGNTLVVGAPGADRAGKAAGSAYVYDLTRLPPSETLTFERVVSLEDGLPSPSLGAIVQDRLGWLWVGTLNGGLNRYDGYAFKTYRHDPADTTSLSHNVVLALLEDQRGALWVGTQGGLNRLDHTCDCFKRYPLYRAPGATTQDIVTLFEDRDGAVWTGTHGRLYHYDPGQDRFAEFEPFTGLPDRLDETYISGIQQDADGALWVLAKNLKRISHSLYRIDQEAGTVTRFKVPEAWNQIGPLLIDSRGRFWINAVEPLRFSADGQRLLPPQRPVADVPWTIYEDRHGIVWHGTPSGVYRLSPEADEATHHPLVEDVNESQANFVARIYEDRSGTLLLGTYGQGLYRVRQTGSDGQPPEAAATPLVLTDVTITNPDGAIAVASYTLDALTLSPQDYNLSLTYAALTYSPRGFNRYRYQLEGYDHGWVAADTRRTALYTNLPPGRYIFRVEAADAEGTTVAKPLALPVIVTPPWWQTIWFRVLALLVIAGFLGAAYRYRVRRLLEREHLRHLAEEKRLNEEEARRLADLDAAKSRFFANVSHEFRTPLTLILGTADRLDDAVAQPIRHNARRLLGLIDQLLDLSKLEVGKLTLEPQPGDLAAHLGALTRAFAPLAERKQITLSFRTDLDTFPAAFDPEKVDTIANNLIANALKFTPEGGKVLVTLARHKDGTQAVAEIIIKDTGPGIPKEALSRIFNRFEQAHGGTIQGAPSGTGIGLALAKELAELHGGTILVESEMGFGSAFIVRLPLAGVDTEQGGAWVRRRKGERDRQEELGPRVESDSGHVASEEEGPALDPLSAFGRPKILIVEDNAEVRLLLRDYLDGDHQIVEAADGEAGLAMARAHGPDLILSDVMMPKMDGVALCRALKKDETLRTVPVVLLTARAEEAAAVEGLEAGADDFMTKPFHAAVLRAKIDTLIAARRQMREQFSKELVVKPGTVVVSSEEEAFLQTVLAAVETRLGDSTFGVDALAGAVSLSRRQLERRLKDATGQTPAEIIRHMRLERAAHLLQARAGSISEIAYAVGFKSANYFSTAFREAFGHSPSEHFDRAS